MVRNERKLIVPSRLAASILRTLSTQDDAFSYLIKCISSLEHLSSPRLPPFLFRQFNRSCMIHVRVICALTSSRKLRLDNVCFFNCVQLFRDRANCRKKCAECLASSSADVLSILANARDQKDLLGSLEKSRPNFSFNFNGRYFNRASIQRLIEKNIFMRKILRKYILSDYKYGRCLCLRNVMNSDFYEKY